MSVCAVRKTADAITVSCDTQLTCDTTISSQFLEFTKMFEKHGIIVAGAGPIREINLLKIFLEKNLIGEPSEENILMFMFDFSQFKQQMGLPVEIECQFIFVIGDKIFSVIQGEVLEIPEYYAIGSGQDFAQAALFLGHSTEESVKVACNLNVYCHEPIKTIVRQL